MIRIVRIEGHVGQLEPHLVVSLPRGPVADGIGAFQLRNLELPLGNQRSRERGPQKIGPLVDRIGPEGRENESPGANSSRRSSM